MNDLLIENKRRKHFTNSTGFMVRGKVEETGKYISIDIGCLRKDSLVAWLKDIEPRNFKKEELTKAEVVLLMILEHQFK